MSQTPPGAEAARHTHQEVLPCCGVELRHTVVTEDASPKNVDTATRMLKFWAERHTRQHRCSLVSESNPTGQVPRKKVAP